MQAPLSTQTAASNLRSVHLLRALLREASYLPDTSARQYFRRYIVNRFRAYQPAHNASPSIHAQAVEKYRHRSAKRRHISIINERTRAMQRKGQKGLNYLRRANLGEYTCLQRILYFTYGRMGKRKYALLEDLLRPDDPTTLLEPSPLQKLYYSNERCLSFFDAPKKKTATHYNIDISNRYSRLKTALEAQRKNGIALGREIKRAGLLTPINNVWERPMPIKRARGNVRRWYAETMTRLLPPLPNDEFDSLQAMVDGTKRVSFAKPRTRAIEQHPAEVYVADRFSKLVHDALVLAKPSKADRPVGEGRPHRLTPRSMRRLYAKVMTYCSKLEWNEGFKKWEAVWGSGLHGMKHTVYSEVTHDDLFGGVDAIGRILGEKQSELRETPIEKEVVANDKTKKRKYTVVPFYIDYLPLDHPVRKEAANFREEKERVQSRQARA
ncbi:hypothetical protein N0V90_011258 [Kalmusia sp. IMI 367209]|nr:hypothetical protein N0V90_011258 [Kalmusia sp. IMI 367209]